MAWSLGQYRRKLAGFGQFQQAHSATAREAVSRTSFFLNRGCISPLLKKGRGIEVEIAFAEAAQPAAVPPKKLRGCL
jgi:hypothetical protein